MATQVVGHVYVPKDKVTILEFVGLVFDTSIILEDKSEVELRTSLTFSSTFLCFVFAHHVTLTRTLTLILSSHAYASSDSIPQQGLGAK